MSEQYFSKTPASESRPARFEETVLGEEMRFFTDAGVFSRGELDRGTRVLLESLPEIRGRALDLGCGWGAVGAALGKKYPGAEIVMADVNERACALARQNLAENRVENARVVESDAFQNISGAFDFIITNPPIRAGKSVIYGMFSAARDFLTPDGQLFIVIRKQQGAPSALSYLEGVYGNARVIEREKGYWVIRCEKGGRGGMKRDRLEKVIRNMQSAKLSQILVSAPASIDYLTGVRVAPGERMVALYVRDNGDCALFANRLFALSPIDGCELIEYSDTEDPVSALLSRVLPGELGVDKDWPCRFALPLAERRGGALALGSAPVDGARMIKTPEEISRMRESSRLNDRAILGAMAAIRPGAKESDVARAYRESASALGAGGESFDSLICFGANCAEPHHSTDDTPLQKGDSVILDVGARLNGYCSDMTRTVFFGAPSDEARRVYDIVRRANDAGRATVRPGVPLRDVDAAARRVIEDAGYGAYFIHRTGHGIGLEVHEFPDVSATSTAVCAPGMVFSVEPGVYLKGRFGVRVEDLVLVTEDGCETLNELSKEMRVIEC